MCNQNTKNKTIYLKELTVGLHSMMNDESHEIWVFRWYGRFFSNSVDFSFACLLHVEISFVYTRIKRVKCKITSEAHASQLATHTTPIQTYICIYTPLGTVLAIWPKSLYICMSKFIYSFVCVCKAESKIVQWLPNTFSHQLSHCACASHSLSGQNIQRSLGFIWYGLTQ